MSLYSSPRNCTKASSPNDHNNNNFAFLSRFQWTHRQMSKGIHQYDNWTRCCRHRASYSQQHAESYTSFNLDSGIDKLIFLSRDSQDINIYIYSFSLISNETNIVFLQGHHEVCHEMFLSLPCSVGEQGITNIVRMRITEYEKKLFQTSANVVFNVQKGIKAV